MILMLRRDDDDDDDDDNDKDHDDVDKAMVLLNACSERLATIHWLQYIFSSEMQITVNNEILIMHKHKHSFIYGDKYA